ncbi:MAG: hypothetical protein ACOCT8_00925 [Actinomycetota bacterium]
MANEASSEAVRWFTRTDAAALAGVSIDTLKRYEKQGRLHGRRRPGCPKGTIEYSYSALVDAGLCEPSGSPQQAPQALATATAACAEHELAVQLAEAQARLASQQDLLEARRVEVERLWELAAQLAGGGR